MGFTVHKLVHVLNSQGLARDSWRGLKRGQAATDLQTQFESFQ